MTDFGTIIGRARRRFSIKSTKGHWGRCEECDGRSFLYPFDDEKNQIWMLCEYCSNLFVKDEDEE